MSRAYSDILFTPQVRLIQTDRGSRAHYEALDHTADRRDQLSAQEAAFIEARDGFYQATVSQTGWPYVQYRGGPPGFIKALDATTLGYADFRGNVQYISVGNLSLDDRVSLIFMDYANQRRLKLVGRARLVDVADDPALVARLRMPGYRAAVERAVIIHVEGYDWNCPQHITPRFTEQEMAAMQAPLLRRLHDLQAQLADSRPHAPAAAPTAELGNGPLALEVTGLRRRGTQVLAITLSAPGGGALPTVEAGAHLEVPVRLDSGEVVMRSYSICSDPSRCDHYEIAVLRQPAGRGGSAAIHDRYRLGMRLRCALPVNRFQLDAGKPAVLIAGGIGITPLRSMAFALAAHGVPFHLHYAARRRREAAYLDELIARYPGRVSVYAGDEGRRFSPDAALAGATPDARFYVCGPMSLVRAVKAWARSHGIDADRIRTEPFSVTPGHEDRPARVSLARSGRVVALSADQTLLEALSAAGVHVPSSCGVGQCGTCAVKALAGRVDHRDTALSAQEREQASLVCVCVSRPMDDELVLDL
ncbi:2Fe-2S iron-sulfur cluster binding domain-containing protein [Aquabacterium fontiphilum]|jgi:ferredoxin-NADP reductase|uniref:2Fe-2S iron-sulfur cluster-binding protein n=1 Tax=Aquabacterium fontiphilum TaxID=450365 RepID=UPI0013769C45|nr:2Fe-2S iron-sulfur cluster-binding protein [Aquabacterium fontiphilum]NBD19105.1 2Fe-2S iron-sulfur cluster binding domain-containing protein [Aquabacterium fontiphilum]